MTTAGNNRQARHIGIIGVSPEGAALFYRQLSRQAARMLPPNEHMVFGLYVYSGTLSSVTLVQFWLLASHWFTVRSSDVNDTV